MSRRAFASQVKSTFPAFRSMRLLGAPPALTPIGQLVDGFSTFE
jgi:hypothetical protein